MRRKKSSSALHSCAGLYLPGEVRHCINPVLPELASSSLGGHAFLRGVPTVAVPPLPSGRGREEGAGGPRVRRVPSEFFYFSSTAVISSGIFSSESERSDSLSRYSMS